MNKLRKQSDTTYPIFFLMVDSTDHVTGKTGLSPTVTISKNGGSFASPAGAVSEVGNGLYKIAGNATDSNTVGELWIHATGTAADPSDCSYTIVAYNPFDAVRLGLTALPNAAAEAAGGLYTRGSGAGQINQPANGQVDANTVKVSGTNQTARDLGASVLISSGTGTGQLSVSSGVISSNMTQIDGNATNGNNAVLKLKSLDVRSNDVAVSAIEVRGATGGAGINGGQAVNIIGGSAGTGGSPGGDAIYLKGGSGTSVRGAGIKIVTPSGGTGIVIDASDTGGSGIEINAEGSCLYLHSDYTCVSLSSINSGSPAVLVYADGTVAPVISITPASVGLQYDGSGISIQGINSSIKATNGIIGDITGDLIGSIGSLETQAKADVNAEVKDVLETDAQAEPTSPPASTASLRDKIAWLFALGKNKRTQTTTTETVLADDGTTPIATSAKSDTGTTFTRGKFQ